VSAAGPSLNGSTQPPLEGLLASSLPACSHSHGLSLWLHDTAPQRRQLWGQPGDLVGWGRRESSLQTELRLARTPFPAIAKGKGELLFKSQLERTHSQKITLDQYGLDIDNIY
jgi:hypothetical protein